MGQDDKKPPQPEISPLEKRERDEVERFLGVPYDEVIQLWSPAPGEKSPVEFGDVADIGDGELLLVYMPLHGEAKGLVLKNENEFHHDKNGAIKRLSTDWPGIKKVLAKEKDLPAHFLEKIAPYRQGVKLDRTHCPDGCHFLNPEQRDDFENKRWDNIDGGTKKNIEKFFADIDPNSSEFLVMAHNGSSWPNWERHGPFKDRLALENFLKTIEGLYKKPTEVRQGIYQDVDGALIKYEVYQGLKLIKEKYFVRGFGE